MKTFISDLSGRLYLYQCCFMLALVSCFNMACNQGQQSAGTDLPVTESCYQASYQRDTALLNLKFAGRKITGKMRINYADGKFYDGTILGEQKGKGDTLILAYDFKINNEGKWHRNPLAFLRRADRLVMGIGQINIVWGTGAFDETVPIDYKHARFVFEPVDCQDNP